MTRWVAFGKPRAISAVRLAGASPSSDPLTKRTGTADRTGARNSESSGANPRPAQASGNGKFTAGPSSALFASRSISRSFAGVTPDDQIVAHAIIGPTALLRYSRAAAASGIQSPPAIGPKNSGRARIPQLWVRRGLAKNARSAAPTVT